MYLIFCVIFLYLVISPLSPEVPGECRCKGKRSKNDNQPKEAINNVELPVKDVTDPMDGAPADIILKSLGQG